MQQDPLQLWKLTDAERASGMTFWLQAMVPRSSLIRKGFWLLSHVSGSTSSFKSLLMTIFSHEIVSSMELTLNLQLVNLQNRCAILSGLILTVLMAAILLTDSWRSFNASSWEL